MPDEHKSTSSNEPQSSTVPAASAVNPSSIGPYQILQKLGEGGMGQVWLAEQLEPVRRKVALKVIKRGMDTEQVVARFEAERQAVAIMDHPTIAKIYDAGETPGGRPYFVMEYVKGEPITSYCDRQRLSTRQRLELFMEVCAGVQHAHQKAVIHRDIKSSNVLVTITDGKPTPKIIDFGVAKAIEHRLTERTLFTEIGVLVGTPEYMSPEQAEMGATDVDTRTDVYSLGVLLYKLLTGALPFSSRELRAAGYEEIRRWIREEQPSKPSTRVTTSAKASTEAATQRGTEPRTLVRELRGDLDWITMRALEKDRTRRYESPAAFADDLRRHLGSEPVLAGPPRATYRASRFVRRHRVGVAVVGTAALVLVVFAVVMTVQAGRIAAARDRANRERDGATRVAGFLADMLERLEPEALGAALWGNLRSHVETARRAQGAPDEDVAVALSSFDELFGGVNPTDAAVQFIDQEILERAGSSIEESLAEEPRIAAQLQHTLGSIYRELGLYDRAEPYYRAALRGRRGVLGDDDPDTLISMRHVGILLDAQGRLEEAESFYSEALERSRRVLGDDHPETLRAIGGMGDLLEAQDRFADAERCYDEALAGMRRVLGDDHPATLTWTNNMGFLLQQQGRYEEAERYYREALEGRRRRLGPNDHATLLSLQNMGSLLESQGRYEEAEEYLLEALARKRRILGDDHPSSLISLSSIADLLRVRGRSAEAESYYHEVLEAKRRVLGAGHPETLATISNLGILLENQGRLAEAEVYYREALETCRRVFGEGHDNTLTTINNMGVLLHKQGKLAEAEEYYREVLEARRLLLGDGHRNTLISLNNLGGLLLSSGKLEEAELCWGEAVEGARLSLGEEHPETLSMVRNLAIVLSRQGRLEEATELHLEAFEGFQRALGPDHSDTVDASFSVGRVLADRGELEEALPYLLAALEGYREVYGAEHEYVTRLLYSLGCLRAAIGEHAEALAHLREALSTGWADEDILTNERLDSLRGNPELDAIVSEVQERLKK